MSRENLERLLEDLESAPFAESFDWAKGAIRKFLDGTPLDQAFGIKRAKPGNPGHKSVEKFGIAAAVLNIENPNMSWEEIRERTGYSGTASDMQKTAKRYADAAMAQILTARLDRK